MATNNTTAGVIIVTDSTSELFRVTSSPDKELQDTLTISKSPSVLQSSINLFRVSVTILSKFLELFQDKLQN